MKKRKEKKSKKYQNLIAFKLEHWLVLAVKARMQAYTERSSVGARISVGSVETRTRVGCMEARTRDGSVEARTRVGSADARTKMVAWRRARAGW